jgi:hypothetical protein
MAQQKIQLRKIRDFGENFSDTFQFIRQEFKPLLISFTLVAGIFMLINAILTGIFEKQALSVLDDMVKGVFYERTVIFTPTYFILIGVSIMSMAAMRTVVSVYMKYYDENGVSPTVQEVWRGFVKYFLKVFLFSVPRYVLIIIGFIFCIAPGVYILVALMPYSFIIISENESFGESFGRCFDIIKENFWISVAIYLIAFLIFSVSSGAIGFTVSAIAGLASYFTTKELSSTLAIVMSVLSVVQYFFYIIFFVSAGLHYYNLVETRDGTGLARRLENLGSNINPNAGIEEQY